VPEKTGVFLARAFTTGARIGEARLAPFHIKARWLRQWQLEPMAALGVFETRSEEPASSAGGADKREKTLWRQSDVKRMIAAAEQAGLQSYRVELAPDGTLSIIVGAPCETAEEPDSGARLAP
jgi:hypothetical protein